MILKKTHKKTPKKNKKKKTAKSILAESGGSNPRLVTRQQKQLQNTL